MGRYAGLTTAENKHTYLYLEPQDNRIIVCVITKLHCTLLSPLLHFVLVAVWTAGREKKKKKDYLCSDKNRPEREQKS